MTRTVVALAGVVAFAVVTAGCLSLERKSSLDATPADLRVLLGAWSSTTILPSPTTCGDFRWNVTEQTGTSASGSFSASCPGGITLSGTAQGTLTGSIVNWSANGTATAPGVASCAFTLTGQGYLETNRIRVVYTGNTCLGPVRGEEILQKS